MKIFLVRHGQIASNVAGVYAGRSEEELTKIGVKQAAATGRKLLDKGIGAIYCSPLARALETAVIIGDLLGLTPESLPEFIEFNYGDWAGKSEVEIARLYPEDWQLWDVRPAELVRPGRETVAELRDRVVAGLRTVVRDSAPAEAALVVSHVAIIRAALLVARRMELNAYRTIPVENAGIFEIDSEQLPEAAGG